MQTAGLTSGLDRHLLEIVRLWRGEREVGEARVLGAEAGAAMARGMEGWLIEAYSLVEAGASGLLFSSNLDRDSVATGA